MRGRWSRIIHAGRLAKTLPKAGTMFLDPETTGKTRAESGRSLLVLVGTNCPKIIRLMSGRTPLMSTGALRFWLYV